MTQYTRSRTVDVRLRNQTRLNAAARLIYTGSRCSAPMTSSAWRHASVIDVSARAHWSSWTDAAADRRRAAGLISGRYRARLDRPTAHRQCTDCRLQNANLVPATGGGRRASDRKRCLLARVSAVHDELVQRDCIPDTNLSRLQYYCIQLCMSWSFHTQQSTTESTRNSAVAVIACPIVLRTTYVRYSYRPLSGKAWSVWVFTYLQSNWSLLLMPDSFLADLCASSLDDTSYSKSV